MFVTDDEPMQETNAGAVIPIPSRKAVLDNLRKAAKSKPTDEDDDRS